MFKTYLVEAYFIDDLLFRKTFKSINNAIKVCVGFDREMVIEITNRITDKVYSNLEVQEMINMFIDESEDFD